jgi:hypothetical protein
MRVGSPHFYRWPLRDVVTEVSRMRDPERLKEIAEQDQRLTVRNAAKRRLGVLKKGARQGVSDDGGM